MLIHNREEILGKIPQFNYLYSCLDFTDKRFLTGENPDSKLFEQHNIPILLSTYEVNKNTVSFSALFNDGDDCGSVVVCTMPEFRHRGYATKTVGLLMNWFESEENNEMDFLEWLVRNDNEKSILLAKKFGFFFDCESENGGWSYYSKVKPFNFV